MTEIVKLSLAQIPEGGMRVCRTGDREIVVCRTKMGIYALDNVCTHAYARLNEGRLRGTRLICPLHGAAFDVRDGRALGAPATRALGVHAVSLHGEEVEIAVSPAQDPAPFTP
jgi:3-phenylpropionate/trans-cinnamate dioxygenase ferredoxin subunit